MFFPCFLNVFLTFCPSLFASLSFYLFFFSQFIICLPFPLLCCYHFQHDAFRCLHCSSLTESVHVKYCLTDWHAIHLTALIGHPGRSLGTVNIHGTWLAIWSRVLRYNMIVAQLVKKFRAFYWTWRFDYLVLKDLPVGPILSPSPFQSICPNPRACVNFVKC